MFIWHRTHLPAVMNIKDSLNIYVRRNENLFLAAWRKKCKLKNNVWQIHLLIIEYVAMVSCEFVSSVRYAYIHAYTNMYNVYIC